MIRRRVVLSVSVVTFVSIVAAGWLVLVTLENRLVANLDRDFRNGTLSQDLREILGSQSRPARPDDFFEPSRQIAVVVYDRRGQVSVSYAAGSADSPAPLPDADDLAPGDGIRTVGSVSGDGRYRAAALHTRSNRIVVATSMATIDETVDDARRILAVSGLAATMAIAGLSWVLVRASFAPVEGMIATADRIAAGDLTERTGVADADDEVGRLGAALDTMLDRIEEAVDAKTASEARLRRFVAEASHELRTPLTSVRGYAELYRQGDDAPEDVARSMQRIESEATRMATLVENLLHLARLDAAPTADSRPVPIARLAGEAIDAVRVVDGDRTYDLEVEAPDATIAGDEVGLRQVLDNLLTNARLHTPPATTVCLSVTGTDAGLVVTVSDDGPGIAELDRAHVFDRFWRATRSDENPVPGSGLGLAIVASIVTAHGGTISVDAASSGGARFTIVFPDPGEPIPNGAPA